MDFSELEKARKIALYKVLCFSFLSFITAVVGLFFLIKYINADNEGMAILVSVIALFVWSWIATSGETTASDFEIQVKEKLLPSVLKNIMQGRGKIKWCSHLDCYASKNNDKTLRRFIKSFNRLDPEDQLRTICYIIFVYSEEIYMNPELKNKLGEISGVRDAITSIGQTIHTEPVTNVEQTLALIRRNSLTKRHNFPNLLSEKYKINI